jgi:hypothetical protein
MLPFAVLGLVMKPLQLKGTCFGVHHLYLLSFDCLIPYYLFFFKLLFILQPQVLLLLNQKKHRHLLKLFLLQLKVLHVSMLL